jgi:hypothetical protein
MHLCFALTLVAADLKTATTNQEIAAPGAENDFD